MRKQTYMSMSDNTNLQFEKFLSRSAHREDTSSHAIGLSTVKHYPEPGKERVWSLYPYPYIFILTL